MQNSLIHRLILTTLGSLLITIGFSELAIRISASGKFDDIPVLISALIFIGWFAFYIVASSVVLDLVFQSIPKEIQPARILINRILLSYLSLLVVFAGIYYSMACYGDYCDAVTKGIDYKSIYRPIIKDLRVSDHERAFRGIENRRWAGVERQAVHFYSEHLYEHEVEEIPVDDLRRAADVMGYNYIISDIKGGMLLFVDCLYFSTVTLTTLGYGDISPRAWYAKLACSLEVLSGLFVIAVSLGIYFNRNVMEKN